MLIHTLIGLPVTIKEILESENNKDCLEDKGNRMDVKTQTEKSEIIIVKVKLTNERDFFHRILFRTATVINDQISICQHYDVIKKVNYINTLFSINLRNHERIKNLLS